MENEFEKILLKAKSSYPLQTILHCPYKKFDNQKLYEEGIDDD